MFAWSRTTYLDYKGILFNFEDKWDRDYFMAHARGWTVISAQEAYTRPDYKDAIRIRSSRILTTNPIAKGRQKTIRKWKKYGNK